MNKRNLKIVLAIVVLLAVSFFWGDFSLFSNKDKVPEVDEDIAIQKTEESFIDEEKLEDGKLEDKKDESFVDSSEISDSEKLEKDKSVAKDLVESEKEEKEDIKKEKEAVKDKDEKKEPVKEESKVTAKTSIAPTSVKKETVSLTVSAKTLLNNMDKLDKNKHGQVPKNGIIFSQEVPVYSGDTVFDILSRSMKEEGIHLEASFTPMYKTNYIEGINNLYEFDAGELSGWMYKVNGSFPNYGASEIKVNPGDTIVWLYTCDLGEDIGGRNIIGGN